MVVIRPMEVEEQPAVKVLILNGLEQRFGTLKPGLNPDLDDLQTHYLAKGATILVAVDEGQVIGCGMLIKEDGSDQIARIVRMSVRADYQGRGLGRQIGETLLEVATKKGFTQVLVETNSDWHSAIRLYKRLGFTPVKQVEVPEFGFTEVHMQLAINPPHSL